MFSYVRAGTSVVKAQPKRMFRFVGSLVQKSIKRATAFLEAGHLIFVVSTKKLQIGKSSFLASILESPERVAFRLPVHS